MWLWSLLTTIPRPSAAPTKLADLGFRVGTHVSIPFLDARTCDGIPIRMDHPRDTKAVQTLFDYGELDPATAHMPLRDRTLQIAVKTYYRNRLIFHGPLFAPQFDYDSKMVELVARDPSLRLEHAFLNHLDRSVVDGISVDGEGMFSLLASAQNLESHDALDWPVLGIIPGKDTTTDSDVTHKVERGDQIWQVMKDIADLAIGPDFAIVPIETDPAELSSGTATWNTGDTIDDGVLNTYTLNYGGAGTIGGLKLEIYAEHLNPRDCRIDLVHPDGTSIRVYTGSKDKVASGSDWLGTSAANPAVFLPASYNSIYGADEAYPHVGTFRSDRSLNAFLDKPASGDWELRIDDVTTNGSAGTIHWWKLSFTLPPPAYARLDVFDKVVEDDPANPVEYSCVFHKGHGKNNAKTFRVRPQGDLVTNQFIATSKTGGTAIRVNDASREEIGTMQGWESPTEKASAALLAAYAKAQVDAHNRPVPAVDLAPKNDSGSNDTLRLGEDFDVGGHVRGIAKVGRAGHDLIVQVRGADLEQHPSAVETRLTVLASVGLGVEGAEEA